MGSFTDDPVSTATAFSSDSSDVFFFFNLSQVEFLKNVEFVLLRTTNVNPLTCTPAKTGRAARMFCVEDALLPTSPTRYFFAL